MTNFPGVYELLVREYPRAAPRSLGAVLVEHTTKGSTVEHKGKKYVVIERSGLPPTGQLLLKPAP